MAKKVSRLFRQFEPEHYDVSLAISPDKSTFSGTVTIRGKKTWRPNQRIVLHQNGLKITRATITKHDKKASHEIPITRIHHHASFHEVRLHTKQTLYPGPYTITLDFEAPLSDYMHGIYPSYFDHEGEKKSIIATQFESHHAREAFPCIDEPEAKAVFQLTLETAPGETVLSNTPILSTKTVAKRVTTIFEPTPRMSTYLLAFIVGELHCHEAKTRDGVAVRSWASVAQPTDSLIYPTAQAVRLLEFFADYFDNPFPLPKLDQVALPDFESGAMENWGLVTYREIALLSDPNNRSLSTEQYVSLVIAHELSHQWFGNLVTMKWWDDLWLNESFASIMEHVALDVLEPSWQQWEQYTASDVVVTSSRDIYKAVQSVRCDVTNPEQINTLFDPAIVYAKGGRLLKMLIDFIGEEVFRKGVASYFKTHAYKNTTRDDLWDSLSEASGRDIRALMNPWLEQSGMPLISISQEKEKVSLRQERFLLDGIDDITSWSVPLLSNLPLSDNLLQAKSVEFQLAQDQPLILNTHGSGHYVTRYESQTTLDYITEAFHSQTIPAEGRINLLNDSLLLARRGDYSLTQVLSIVARNSSEPREAVWALMTRAMGQAGLLTEASKLAEADLKNFKCSMASALYKKVGWGEKKSDDVNTILLRHLLIGLLVGGEDKEVIKQCLAMNKRVKSAEELPSDLRAIILTAVVRHGDKKYLEQLINEYQTNPNPDVQLAICMSLTDTRDIEFAKLLMQQSIGKGGFVRQQDTLRWFAYFMRNKHTRVLAWDWLKTHWDYLKQTFGDAKMFDDIPAYAAMALATPEWQKEYVAFFTPLLNELPLQRNITIALAEIEARVAWHKRDSKSIAAWLRAQSKAG